MEAYSYFFQNVPIPALYFDNEFKVKEANISFKNSFIKENLKGLSCCEIVAKIEGREKKKGCPICSKDIRKNHPFIKKDHKEYRPVIIEYPDGNFVLFDQFIPKFIRDIPHTQMGYLLSGIGHNMNSPLSAIIGRAELVAVKLSKLKKEIKEYEEDLEKISNYIDIIIRNVEILSEIIQNMMQKSNQLKEIKSTQLNISKILKEETDYLMGDMRFKHQIRKEIDLPINIPLFQGFYNDLSFCFNRILNFSIDYLMDSEKKELKVLVTHDKEKKELKVEIRMSNNPNFDLKDYFLPLFLDEFSLFPDPMGLHPVREILNIYDCQPFLQKDKEISSLILSFPIK